VQDLKLTQQQKNNLVAFLQTLTGSAVYTDPKWSDPFNPQGELSLIILPSDAISIRRNADGTATISAKGAPNLVYQLQAATTLPNWVNLVTVTANAAGVMEYTVDISGSMCFRFVYQVPAS
jgi:cytochrome c peroxidase